MIVVSSNHNRLTFEVRTECVYSVRFGEQLSISGRVVALCVVQLPAPKAQRFPNSVLELNQNDPNSYVGCFAPNIGGCVWLRVNE